jgi:hypothetical protein
MMKRDSQVVMLLLGAGSVLAMLGCNRPGSVGSPVSGTTATPRASLFRDVADAAGIDLRWGPRDPSKLTILDMMGFGCAFLDYDGDGKLDILLVARDHVELYRNRGNGTFENVTAHAFPDAPRQPYLMGCSVCDYDLDGHPDIFVSGYGRTILYHNEGDGTFRDVTDGSGLAARGPDDWTTSAAWADIDGDGSPDLYVCRYIRFSPGDRQLCAYDGLDNAAVMMACSPTIYGVEHGSLYRNDGHGKFHEITQQAGLADAHGNGLGCMFCDFNNDGLPDLYIANDQCPADLYLNLGHGRFRNIAVESGTAYDSNGKLIAGMGVDWGDYDNDGRFDLLVAAFSNQPKCLFHNQGNRLFANNSGASGLSAPSLSSLTFGASFVDVDNDGLLDIVLVNGHVQSMAERVDTTTTYYESALLFHNEGGGQFRDITGDAGSEFTQKIVGRGIAVGDYDGDGRLDLLVVNAEGRPLLLHNEEHRNHFLSLRCFGGNGVSDALGARVSVTTGERTQMREVRAAGSYLSSDAPDVHFGMGDATKADKVTIRWPGGKVSSFASVAADHAYVLAKSDKALRQVR